MSYHLTIKRDGAASPITDEEFARASRGISELRHDPVIGKAEFFQGDELRATLMLQDGAIWTSVAEPDVVRVMTRLANQLCARVLGDEDEWYSGDGQAHFDAEREKPHNHVRVKRSRMFWNVARIVLIAVVAYLMYRNHR